MSELLPGNPKFNKTMSLLEGLKRSAENGTEYWFARELQVLLGYHEWRNFEGVIERAASSLSASGTAPSHHIVEVNKKVKLGSGAQRDRKDYFLSRGACYLIAMNGDPSKPEIAAAQSYFATQTREREIETEISGDEKRLALREKTKKSFKAVSGAAKEAGVKNTSQARFHDARYLGLYGMPGRSVKAAKGLDPKENTFDRMGTLELSANDFQMNLAAETLSKEGVKGETRAIQKNKAIAERVRRTMLESGARPPEELPVEEPIREVQKRINAISRKTSKLPPTTS